MSAEQLFNRWIKWTLLLFGLVFGYYLAADLYMPVTTDSLVQRYVVQVAPQVPGRVVSVAVQNNQQVKKGDLLFELDPTDYQLKLEQAQLQLEQSQQNNRHDEPPRRCDLPCLLEQGLQCPEARAAE